jgi:hypothetical protein
MIAGYFIVAAILVVGLFLGWKTFFPKREGFQDTIAGGKKIKASKEMCEKLQVSINQYKEIRKEHPDVEIRNLDETLEQMNEYYTLYGCDTY